MPGHARHTPGGLIYHVLNRCAGRRDLFDVPGTSPPSSASASASAPGRSRRGLAVPEPSATALSRLGAAVCFLRGARDRRPA
jgi:hypothetical protein